MSLSHQQDRVACILQRSPHNGLLLRPVIPVSLLFPLAPVHAPHGGTQPMVIFFHYQMITFHISNDRQELSLLH